MRTFIIIIMSFLFCTAGAQNATKTITLHVSGNCGECKDRIENAADIKGVKNATWEEKTQVLSVTYDSQKVSLAQIEEAIAKAGHTTTNKVADNKSYKKLPDCCKYEQGACKEK